MRSATSSPRRRLEVFAEHDELVAAEPGDGVAHPHHGANALGSLTEKHVACLVPETVVHHLEVVEVEEQHREDAALAGRQWIACRVRSGSSTRFGRSVSVLCVAWCASSASARADFRAPGSPR